MRTIVYIGTSLDGFIARENGDIGWLAQYANAEAVRTYEAFINRIDAIVIGRGTFEKALEFATWPYKKKVFVLSTTLHEVPQKLIENVTILSMDPVSLLGHLFNKGFSNIYIDGGKLIQSFLREDLIDELIISKAPLLIGTGIPLFGYLDGDIQFKHVRTDTYANGLVKSYYERKRI